MSNIINTYLKIQKCTFQEYEDSIKDINTLYFIIDELKVYIGSHEYMTANTAKEFEELLNNSILPEFQGMVKEYIDEQLKNIVLEEVNLPVDQTYDSTSKNAQSGIAVAEATYGKLDKDLTLIKSTNVLGGNHQNIYFYVYDATTKISSKTSIDTLKTELHKTLQTETIEDSGNHYDATTVEGALQEIGTKFGDIDTALDNIIAIQNSYIGGASE